MTSRAEHLEACINCQGPILTMAFKGSGVCSDRCSKAQGRGTFTLNEIRHKIVDLVAEVKGQYAKSGLDMIPLQQDKERRLVWDGRLEIIRRLEAMLK